MGEARFASARAVVRREIIMRKTRQLLSSTGRWAFVVGGGLLFTIAMSQSAAARIGHGTPEIDPGSIASAITLFTGGAMYITSRRRAR